MHATVFENPIPSQRAVHRGFHCSALLPGRRVDVRGVRETSCIIRALDDRLTRSVVTDRVSDRSIPIHCGGMPHDLLDHNSLAAPKRRRRSGRQRGFGSRTIKLPPGRSSERMISFSCANRKPVAGAFGLTCLARVQNSLVCSGGAASSPSDAFGEACVQVRLNSRAA